MAYTAEEVATLLDSSFQGADSSDEGEGEGEGEGQGQGERTRLGEVQWHYSSYNQWREQW